MNRMTSDAEMAAMWRAYQALKLLDSAAQYRAIDGLRYRLDAERQGTEPNPSGKVVSLQSHRNSEEVPF